MGSLVGRGLFIEGYFARLMYRCLYKMHEAALHGARPHAARARRARRPASADGEAALSGSVPITRARDDRRRHVEISDNPGDFRATRATIRACLQLRADRLDAGAAGDRGGLEDFIAADVKARADDRAAIARPRAGTSGQQA